MSIKNLVRGLFFASTVATVAAKLEKHPIRGMSHTKYRKWQRKNRKKAQHQRGRG